MDIIEYAHAMAARAIADGSNRITLTRDELSDLRKALAIHHGTTWSATRSPELDAASQVPGCVGLFAGVPLFVGGES
jgi:hypothetical protein